MHLLGVNSPHDQGIRNKHSRMSAIEGVFVLIQFVRGAGVAFILLGGILPTNRNYLSGLQGKYVLVLLR